MVLVELTFVNSVRSGSAFYFFVFVFVPAAHVGKTLFSPF